MPVNYYKASAIQKKLPMQTDEQFEYTQMKICKHVLICGSTGTGKTNCLIDYIVQTSKPKNGTFTKIFVCYKTREVLYDYLAEQLKEKIEFYNSVSEFPSVNDFRDAAADDYKNKYLVGLDDCIIDTDKESCSKTHQYFTYGRKKNITIFYLSQSFFQTSGFIRKQISYLLLLSIKGKTDLNSILREYGSLHAQPEQLFAIFKYATCKTEENDMPFLKVNAEACKDSERFSRDWTDFIQFQSDKDAQDKQEK